MDRVLEIEVVKQLGKGYVMLCDCNILIGNTPPKDLALRLTSEIYLLMLGVNEAEIYEPALAQDILDTLIS